MRLFPSFPLRPLAALALAASLTACGTLPRASQHPPSRALAPTARTFLDRTVAPLAAKHPGKSGIFPIDTGGDALLARLALADRAERSLDVQYYIWHPDKTGLLLAGRLIEAADRGVRVRLLLDDLGNTPGDRTLRALDSHSNIEVRLFNPVTLRAARGLGMVLEFPRINRRMHNKSFTADNRMSIVGGRNVGDEYFEAGAELDFSDLDVLAVGPVVREISTAFDLYWNSAASVPIVPLTRSEAAPGALARLRKRLHSHRQAMRTTAYRQALNASPLAQWPRRRIDFVWGHARTFYDHPDKIAASDSATHLAPQLRPYAETVRRELFIVSAYFVPGRAGLELIAGLRQRGVRVVVLTNSLASTDVRLVHAGYQRYREPLLRMGVEIYEAKPTTSRRARGRRNSGLGSSSRASLHAKTFIADRRLAFVGSLNIDPRSLNLNTEIGILFESPALAASMARRIDRELASDAWRVELTPAGLRWRSDAPGGPRIFAADPAASFCLRAWIGAAAWLPIESQL